MVELLASRNFVFINELVFWRGKSMTTIVTIGIDLAKNVFAVHGVDATGKPALVRSSVPRAKLLELIASRASEAKMMQPMPLPSARPLPGPTCASCPSSRSSNKASCWCTAPARVSWSSAPPPSTASGACWLSWASCCHSRVRREALARLEELPGWINTVIGEVSRLARPGHTTPKLDLRRGMLDWLKGIKGEKSSQARLTNGAPGARLSSGSAANRCRTNDRL